MIEENIIDKSKDYTLLELLDRVLNKGVVISGDIVISIADVDLVYVGLKILLTSVETMQQRQLMMVKSNRTISN